MAFSPYDAARDTLSRARDLLDAASGQPDSVASDMRRLSIVMAVSALDTYLHRLVVARVYEHKKLPGGLASLSVTFSQLLAEADASVDARKQAKAHRPRVRAKRILRDRLQRETFQNSEDVSRALGMAGKHRSWSHIAAAMSGSTRGDSVALRAQLDAYVKRRNAMVHEGDYERKERPQNPTRNPLGPLRRRRRPPSSPI